MANDDTTLVPQADVPLATVGPIAVCASREEVDEWCATLDLPPAGEALPFTYPIRWLTHGSVRAALVSALAGRIPVHQAQSFHYRRSLLIDETLTLRVSIFDRGGARRQLHLRGSVFAEDGACVLEMRSEIATIGKLEAAPA
ncbi:hypothetical protein [Bosea sp. (in: a-proteobacteria)]|jgi:hypothetical protein|uniref:hypothetical protein n=1 Tax=Bosea sp. (in: a-proteobacteria) TaxID=1871050 RepID=UPI003F709DCA